jgi:hypothetical protein
MNQLNSEPYYLINLLLKLRCNSPISISVFLLQRISYFVNFGLLRLLE